MKYLHHIDLNGVGQLQNAVLQPLATAPPSPSYGQIYTNSVTNKIMQYQGAVLGWVVVGTIVGTSLTNGFIKIDGTDVLVYEHPTVDGSKHIPSGGSSGKIIGWLSTGTGQWIDAPEGISVVDNLTTNSATTALSAKQGLTLETNKMDKRVSSTSGNIPTWDGTTGKTLNDGYVVETSLVGATTAIPRADAVKAYIDGLVGANKAMVFKDLLGTGGMTSTAFNALVKYDTGWTYIVSTAGTYKGVVADVGDMFIAKVTRASGGVNGDWAVIQANIVGAVTSVAGTVVDGQIPLFSGTSGLILKGSGKAIADFAPAVHNHDTVYPKKVSFLLGSSTSQVITHGLNTQEFTYSIRDTASPYELVSFDVSATTVNTATVSCLVAPTANKYRITFIG